MPKKIVIRPSRLARKPDPKTLSPEMQEWNRSTEKRIESARNVRLTGKDMKRFVGGKCHR
jgi:hypothetical protein